MNQILNEEHQSFQNKIHKINQSNQLLDQLEKKMQNLFVPNILYADKNSQHNQHQYMDQKQIKTQTNRYELSQPRYLLSNYSDANNDKDKSKSKQIEDRFDRMISSGAGHPKTNMETQFYKLDGNKHQKSQKQFKDGSFKLFPKNKKKQHQVNPQFVTQNSNFNQRIKQSENINILNKSQKILAHHQHYQTVQELLMNKLRLKQSTITQLQDQLRIQNQQRVHLYKINIKLEEQYNDIKNKQAEYLSSQRTKLQKQIEILKIQLENKRRIRKTLKKEQNLLKNQQKSVLQNRKTFLTKDKQLTEAELNLTNLYKTKDTKSKTFFQSPNPHSQDKCNSQLHAHKGDKMLLDLVTQLDRLKNYVQKRMKESQSKKSKNKQIQ